MGEACGTYEGDRTGAYWLLVGRAERKRPFGRPRRRWIILDWIFKKWDVEAWGWIGLAQYRDWWQALVNAVMNLRVA